MMNKSGALARKLAALPQYLQHLGGIFREEARELGRLSMLLEIMNNELLDTYFQPILHLRSGKTVGHEVLNRPPSSPQFPSTEHFYDFAGRTEQMFRFEQYCRRMSLSRYMERVPVEDADGDKLVFINVHPGVLNDSRHKSGETLMLLKELGLAPERVVFELTERQAVQDYIGFEKVLSHYREQGFRIAVDDAGSGYNSLKTLVYLKPEFIKLDKSLIRGIHGSREQQELLELVREYAERSSTRVIAEGIETVQELQFLQMAGVDFGQGYALGRPAHHPGYGGFPASALQFPVRGGYRHVSSNR
ncbi:EAL domain-containing protein [Paenibacillus sp. MMS20-IR301]|uniref:EAL domain-containing protein n=1 Tax=Paenibacillus sp. MMS20-IR301 TaxID=2895946 RepID=UPI0028EC99B8|nr:EAL domain-containing protein [Paenibacillus sp. MMS20-IR301]WNS45771.1 EAL domain-containing protein [Paenibacillus sp. MMS20-IR301]